MYKIFLLLIWTISFSKTYYQSLKILALPQSNEYQSLKTTIKNHIKDETKYIHILRPNWFTGARNSLTNFSGNDYGIYSSSISTSIKNMVFLALKSNNYDPNKFVISSSVENPSHEYDKFGEKIPNQKNLIIVDFSNPEKPFIKDLDN